MIRFMKNINIISRCATQFRGEQLAGIGLNGCHIDYILNICRSPGITQDQLAQTIHVNSSNVTRQLSVLETNGFVERRQSAADKRMVEVYPTTRATGALPRVREVLGLWNDSLTAGLSNEEQASFEDLLDRVARQAERLACGKSAER